jgi:hypothetical protein
MKKIFFILSLFLVTAQMSFGQCNFQLSDNWSWTTVCAPANVTVSGQTSLTYVPSGGGNDPCPGSSVTVQLQKYNGATWTVQTSTIVNTGFGSGSYSFTMKSSGQYRIVGIPTAGSSCAGCGFSTFTKTPQTVTVITAPSSSYKVDGVVVNPSTYIQTYLCQPIQMTDIIANGTGANNGYEWKVEIQKIGVSTDGGSWASGTPPTTWDLRASISAFWGASNLTGQYIVKLWVRNYCNTTGVAYTGLVQINTSPSATTSCVLLTTNNTCSSFTFLGTQSNPANVCAGSPKINASCSGGQYIGGYYRVKVDEYNLSNQLTQIVVNLGNTTINSTNDIVCLDLNVLSSPQGFFFTNASSRKYRLEWTIGNACGESTQVGWFIDNIGGCKTDGEEVATGLEDQNQESDNITIYPNPTTDKLNISWLFSSIEKPIIKLYCMDGKQLEVPMRAIADNEMQLDVSTLAKGVYMLELNNGTRSTKRVIIQ